jgi:glycerol kinase
VSSYIAAIDQGTTSSRFIVFDNSGRIASVAQKEHEQIYPRAGWVEHDAEEIWRRTQEVIVEAMQLRGFRPKDIAAIGITNQRETTVVWNRKTSKPVYNALVWQDTRVEEEVAQFARNGVRPVTRGATTALGSVYAAGLAVGFFPDSNALRANWAADHTWNPVMEAGKREGMYRMWKRAVTKSFDWIDQA